MSKTKEWLINNFGFRDEMELNDASTDAELLSLEEEYLYWLEEQKQKGNDA